MLGDGMRKPCQVDDTRAMLTCGIEISSCLLNLRITDSRCLAIWFVHSPSPTLTEAREIVWPFGKRRDKTASTRTRAAEPHKHPAKPASWKNTPDARVPTRRPNCVGHVVETHIKSNTVCVGAEFVEEILDQDPASKFAAASGEIAATISSAVTMAFV